MMQGAYKDTPADLPGTHSAVIAADKHGPGRGEASLVGEEEKGITKGHRGDQSTVGGEERVTRKGRIKAAQPTRAQLEECRALEMLLESEGLKARCVYVWVCM